MCLRISYKSKKVNHKKIAMTKYVDYLNVVVHTYKKYIFIGITYVV